MNISIETTFQEQDFEEKKQPKDHLYISNNMQNHNPIQPKKLIISKKSNLLYLRMLFYEFEY